MELTPDQLTPKLLRTAHRMIKRRSTVRKRRRGPGPKQRRLGQAI